MILHHIIYDAPSPVNRHFSTRPRSYTGIYPPCNRGSGAEAAFCGKLNGSASTFARLLQLFRRSARLIEGAAPNTGADVFGRGGLPARKGPGLGVLAAGAVVGAGAAVLPQPAITETSSRVSSRADAFLLIFID